MPLLQSLTTWFALNSSNDVSASGINDPVTGAQIFIGDLDLGVYFDLTEAEANSMSYTAVGTLHAGRYRRIKVDSGATASNIRTGTIGLMKSLALGVNVVTSYDQGLASGLHPVVFLNVITPGNFGFVQELGDASVLGAAAITKGSPAVGDIVNSVASGLVDDPTVQENVPATIGTAMQVPVASALFRIQLDGVPIVQG